MFGSGTTIAIPDLDRTDYLLCLGANPLASNGSLMTAPDVRGRLRGDPQARRPDRRGRPAALAHRPGGRRAPRDPARAPTRCLLMAVLHVIFAERLGGAGRSPHVADEDLATVRALAADFTPEAVAPATGLDAERIRAVARGLRRRAVRRRLRPHRHHDAGLRHDDDAGSIDVLNVVTGNLDRAGGAMFP